MIVYTSRRKYINSCAIYDTFFLIGVTQKQVFFISLHNYYKTLLTITTR